MRADLHTHSLYSDGQFSPIELVKIAKRNGVELLSITDHDNFYGEDEKRNAANSAGITYLTGVEISAYEGKVKTHITGYGYDATSGLCKKYQAERLRRADDRLLDVIERLRYYQNIVITPDEAYAQVKRENTPVHTRHIVGAILERGYFQSVGEAFRTLFTPDKPTYSFVGRPTPDEAIEIIHSMGGIACIAHPGRIALAFKEREKLIRSLKDRGMDGIESNYPSHTERETEYFHGLAKELNLFQTGGSDFHYDDKRREVGTPNFTPSDEFLAAVKLK